jgi:hypothetical protein
MCEGLPDFGGKLVFVNFADGGECQRLLVVPRFENQQSHLDPTCPVAPCSVQKYKYPRQDSNLRQLV